MLKELLQNIEQLSLSSKDWQHFRGASYLENEPIEFISGEWAIECNLDYIERDREWYYTVIELEALSIYNTNTMETLSLSQSELNKLENELTEYLT